MIDISPKGLRFARLVAQQQIDFSNDPQLAVIERDEASFGRGDGRVDSSVKISERTADFCIRAMSAFLNAPGRFESDEWDGNDVAFMRAVTDSLREQLLQPNVQSR